MKKFTIGCAYLLTIFSNNIYAAVDVFKLIEPPRHNKSYGFYDAHDLIADCANLNNGCIRFIDGILQQGYLSEYQQKVSYCIPGDQTIADIASSIRLYFFDGHMDNKGKMDEIPARMVIYSLNKAYPCKK